MPIGISLDRVVQMPIGRLDSHGRYISYPSRWGRDGKWRELTRLSGGGGKCQSKFCQVPTARL